MLYLQADLSIEGCLFFNKQKYIFTMRQKLKEKI